MIRTTITPDTQTISFDIPTNYIGKQIEVIAFAKDEETSSSDRPIKKIVSFEALSFDTRGYRFNRDEANER
ncbi:MAG: hypothetical protein ACRYFA_02420 [Janthinobacterium lividum]